MSADFFKLYPGFFEGSLRDSPPYPSLLFLAMLSQADENGIVLGAPSFWVAYVGRAITLQDVKDGLHLLGSPDPESTSPDEGGRRIVPWGDGANQWRIVNYRKYYEKSRNADRLKYKNDWQSKKRGQVKTDEDNDDHDNESESDNERKVEKEQGEKRVPPERDWVFEYAEEIGLPGEEAESFCDHFDSNGWKVGGKTGMKDWRAALRNWKKRCRGPVESFEDTAKKNLRLLEDD